MLQNNNWNNLIFFKQLASYLFLKDSNKLFIRKPYVYTHLPLLKQMTDIKLNCYCYIKILKSIFVQTINLWLVLKSFQQTIH